MRRVKVEVTAEDIRDGKPGKYASCPVALALRRATGIEFGVVRHAAHAFKVRVGLPFEVYTFIENFDRSYLRSLCKPFAFEIDLPDEIPEGV